ncbi:GDP-L-fucose synthase family protein [Kushneria aurantia]|uniref:GDP-L-fucose synthase n=1 Tax=Kushneria aurantia TaxID=504092 RepID=A0ABV6G3G7_9GAMM|nr:GDP-L-fucose synthase [Kushneria aurantia]
MRVLLTGGSGMVGRNILEHRSAGLFEILAPSSSELNLLDQASVKDYISAVQPDLIIHAAGRVGGIQANIADPAGFLVQNSLMGIHVINEAYRAGVKYCINLASSCMYPRDALNPLHENQILKGELEPTNEGYALAKVTATKLCQYISETDNDVSYVTLIPCNLYGRHDNFDPHSSHMIPAVIRKIHEAHKNGSFTVEIWGDGNARREFMYAEELADCIFSVIAEIQRGGPASGLMNVGIGRDYSINEYYKAVADVVGYKGEFSHDLSRPVGMRQKLIDSSRINNMGWCSSTRLADGISKTYEYFLQEVDI